ncbi:MAG: carboxylating nicotinate-nucleotide diphosphorylase [Bdellovibrionaceae bacterium]|nr:carboxylating nicotinate-nucleotide diphosphorylase [Pseudobdellovibrionaceae bacterium]
MLLNDLIKAAIKEDMPTGDVTTDSLGLTPKLGKAVLKAKEDIVLSGLLPFESTMMLLEPNAKIKWHFEEGQRILKGQNICSLEGDLIQILKGERVSLNFLGHLSGIASHTRRFVDAVAGTKTRILDTRKTLPGYRDLEKRAVVHGGGYNHRMNLSTAILIKDNHIAVMGGIQQAVQRVRKNSNLDIEVEACTLDEVKIAVSLNVRRILLDNMDTPTLVQARTLIPDTIETEASGNMSLARVPEVARVGIDFISVGALTHSAPVADVSLQFDWQKK